MREILEWLKRLETRLDKLAAQVVRQPFGVSYSAVYVTAVSYTLTATNSFVVFTATGQTATLPAATGGGQTYRIALEVGAAASLTIDGNAADTIKGSLTQTLYDGEDLIITDYATGKWA